jgi:peptidoglycan/LPS O-acetylase OafA/YrhL
MGLLYTTLDPDSLGAATPVSEGWWLNALKYNPLVRLTEFVIGLSLGLLFLRNPGVLGRRSHLVALATLGIVLLVLTNSSRVPYPIMNNGLLLGPFALLILALAAGRGFLAGFLSSPAMILLGEASYALYILHVPVHSILRRIVPVDGFLAPQSTGFLIVYLIGSVVVAILVLKAVEEPARRALRRKLVSWLDSRPDRTPQRATANVPKAS